MCVQNDWRLLKGDVTAAFLQGKTAVQNKYALAPPELAEAMNLPKGERVIRLLKSVYGLTTAPLEWFRRVDEVLKALGAEQCVTDPCVWRVVREGRLIGLIGAHVDDFLFFAITALLGNSLSKFYRLRSAGPHGRSRSSNSAE